MLELLKISNYALIDELEIEFRSGFSIITGETGAGKSIILGALGILLGQRADLSVIRNKEKKCVAEAHFDIKNYNLKKFLENNDLDYFEQTIIRREISPSGRSRAFVNDSPVNLSQLKEIGNALIDIHSQHDTLQLNKTDFQIDVIDVFAKNENIRSSYKKTLKNYKKLQKELAQLQAQADKEKSDFDYYQFRFEQLDEANLVENEQAELEEEQKLLSHAEEIKQNFSQINGLLSDDDFSILNALKSAVSTAQDTIKVFSQAKEIHERLESAYIELQDLSSETEILANDIEDNPERLEFVNQRLDTIYGLQQKFSAETVAELLEQKAELQKNLENISSFDEQISEKRKIVAEEYKKISDLAKKLTASRSKVIPQVEKKIKELLDQLGMPNASFAVKNEQLKDFQPNGTDNITFLFSANKKVEAKEISKVASGGELSRLMLSLKYLISQSKTLPTIIFDEIDTGVSGEIASKVGGIMKKMSKKLQVIDITHLPQVAAQGDYHYLVYKQDLGENATTSNIKKLSDADRITEIAKMLSGENLTDAAIENAKQLLNN